MRNKDEMKGKVEHAKGNIKERIGDMTGDDNRNCYGGLILEDLSPMSHD